MATSRKVTAADKQLAAARLPREQRLANLAAANAAPVAAVQGAKPTDSHESREIVRRAIAEILVQPGSLKRLRQLLLQPDRRGGLNAWTECFNFLKETKGGESAAGPISINLNNFIPRPRTKRVDDAITVEPDSNSTRNG